MVTIHDSSTFGTWQTDPFNGDAKGINMHSPFTSLMGALLLAIPPEMKSCWGQSSSTAFHLTLPTFVYHFDIPYSHWNQNTHLYYRISFNPLKPTEDNCHKALQRLYSPLQSKFKKSCLYQFTHSQIGFIIHCFM